MEASLRKRVTELVDAATRKDEMATDPELIRRLKELCRYAERDSGTVLVFELLMQRLKDSHAQVCSAHFEARMHSPSEGV